MLYLDEVMQERKLRVSGKRFAGENIQTYERECNRRMEKLHEEELDSSHFVTNCCGVGRVREDRIARTCCVADEFREDRLARPCCEDRIARTCILTQMGG